MPRRLRPQETQRSEHWLRVVVNESTETFNREVCRQFGWATNERLIWLSPLASDAYAEYYDEAFLERLGVTNLRVPLSDFWPPSGPRWDGLAKTETGKLILVEAKAYIEEGVDFRSRAEGDSLTMIKAALSNAKQAFDANEDAVWETPFYQYANRLAHLYYLRELNGLDAYLLFLYFADASDVPNPSTVQQWQGAKRVIEKALGLGMHPLRQHVQTLILDASKLSHE